jgi:small subunit ribosomal protein S3
MGQKVNPTVFRLGMSEQWRSRWFSDKGYAQLLKQDILIRKHLKKRLAEAGIDRIDIERFRGELVITVIAAKPGIIIGRGGTGIEDLRKEIISKFMEKGTTLKINIQEVDNPNLSAGNILQTCIVDIEKRIPFRRIMKQNIDKVLKAGAQGVKIGMAGRLNGAEIARRETLTQGKIPLHTLRGDIQYARGTAHTTYGTIGIKIWIYKGLYFPEDHVSKEKENTRASKVPARSRIGSHR